MNINEFTISHYDPLSQTFTVEIPLAFLSDPVMLNLMYDPILSPSGSTFHRSSYMQSLNTNNEDPITREIVSPAQLVTDPFMREINFSLINAFPEFEINALSDTDNYIREKTGHGISWFKHRHLFFMGNQGIYRLLKFADTFDSKTQNLGSERRKFIRQNKGISAQFRITHLDGQSSLCRVEIPLSTIMCPEMKKMMVDPITCDNNQTYHKTYIPSLIEKNARCAPNNILRSLCHKIFMAMPHLNIFNPYEIFRYAIEHSDAPLLNTAIAQFPDKINDTVCYKAEKFQSALMFAIEKRKPDMAQILLSSPDINISIVDSEGATALDYVKAIDHKETVEKLAYRLLIEGLLNNDFQYRGKGQKISDEVKKIWKKYQPELLMAFKNTVNQYIAEKKFTEAFRLLSLASQTTNCFHQLLQAFTGIKIEFSLRPLKMSRMTSPGNELKEFVDEGLQRLESSLNNNLG